MSEATLTQPQPAAVDAAAPPPAAEPSVGIVITDSAVSRVRELLEEEGNAELMLRVFISGGGCAGFQYGFTFDDARGEDDLVMERDGVVFLVDSMSHQYLTGSEIDFRNDLQGAQFVIRNPNITSTCGCGSSFSV